MIRLHESIAAVRGFAALALCLLFFALPSGAHAASDIQRLFIGVPPELAASGMMRHIADRFAEDKSIHLSWQILTNEDLFTQQTSCFVDAIITNIPEHEQIFVKNGLGQGWYALFHSRLLLVGPPKNPGGIPRTSLLEAMHAIAARRLPFAASDTVSSQRDAERFIWSRLQPPQNEPKDRSDWYFLSSPEQGARLAAAAEKQAYTLATRWEWTEFTEQYTHEGKEPPLAVIVDSDILLNSQYDFIILSQEHCPLVHLEAARMFAEWSMEPETQRYFAAFRYSGQKIFHAMDPGIDTEAP